MLLSYLNLHIYMNHDNVNQIIWRNTNTHVIISLLFLNIMYFRIEYKSLKNTFSFLLSDISL